MANVFAVAGPNSKYQQPDAAAAGFLAGLWHGLLFPLTFIVSLFDMNVRIYETNNIGRWYDFGFLLGASSRWAAGNESGVCPECGTEIA